MSESDRPERSRFSFTETYFGAKVIGGMIGFGLWVIILSEMFRPKHSPKPVWLDALEGVYLMGALAAVNAVAWAFNTGEIQTVIRNANCAVEVVRTEGSGEIVENSRNKFEVKDLSDTTHSTDFWQQVQTPNGPRWASKAILNTKRALPECKA